MAGKKKKKQAELRQSYIGYWGFPTAKAMDEAVWGKGATSKSRDWAQKTSRAAVKNIITYKARDEARKLGKKASKGIKKFRKTPFRGVSVIRGRTKKRK